jgi:hypothetical protein
MRGLERVSGANPMARPASNPSNAWIYNGNTVTLPIDTSPLWISLATTCAATAATFFLGMLAARLMYGVRGSLRA